MAVEIHILLPIHLSGWFVIFLWFSIHFALSAPY